MSKARLKRARMFSSAITFVSSTSCALVEVLAQRGEQLVVTPTGVRAHRHRIVEHEPLELVEGVAVAVAGQRQQLLLGDARAGARSEEPMSTQNSQL